MPNLKASPESKTLLVECLTPQSKPRMAEVNDIAKAAGYNVVSEVTQRREAIDGAYCIGEGKLDEISKTIGKDSIKVLIFTRQLSPGQMFRIKKKIGEGVRVLDRNLLILEVFEKRANSRESQLQIALAKMRYTFSWGRESIRMRGIVSEQMGRGGPGQYPYEAYEAMSRKRISKMEKELREIRARKANLREHRGNAGFRMDLDKSASSDLPGCLGIIVVKIAGLEALLFGTGLPSKRYRRDRL